jgi:hypothetical protein
MIDRVALLATLKPRVVEMEDFIRERAMETAAIAEHLQREHDRAVEAERTAMSLEEWRDGEITQAAVAWILGCVFVRFLEDNGLIDRALISGPGGRRAAALGHREEHFRAHPEHSDREYLETCFRTVSAFPAVAPLYDERHNPLWLLGPTADGARTLRETFTAIDPDNGVLLHDFSDPDLGTRFLGDLYQDLSESAKKRYALLQTPDFVERFILDRTLTPAIDEFGLGEVRLIDPTCGSGHFLIDAFERLFALWVEREPGTSATVLAQRALDQIAGVDLNPYATAIARFRLMVVALRLCRIARLAEAPAFKFHLATGDSLLHGPLPADGATMLFDANRLHRNIAHVYESEDAAELKYILGRGYHAVVGNPPYITGDDEAVRAAYKVHYATCYREFALTVPFMERFFELAKVRHAEEGRSQAGYVGKITGNNFLRREFGTKLVNEFLRSMDVDLLVDASGAYLPGHGTPTVLLFGRSRQSVTHQVRVVDNLRTQATQPPVPAEGLVWRAIEEYADRPGEGNEYARTSIIDQQELFRHPVSLGPGRDLAIQITRDADTSVAQVIREIGYSGQTNIDDLMLRPCAAWARTRVGQDLVVDLAVGDAIRDWTISSDTVVWFPYTETGLLPAGAIKDALITLWPWRTLAWARRTFSKRSYRDEGRPWFEWHQIALRRVAMPRAIAWAFVATHNHFMLERGKHAFKQSALVLQLNSAADERDYFGILGCLNSSVVLFWLKQVMHDRGGGGIGGGIAEEAWERFYEFSAARVGEVPLPSRRSPSIASAIDSLAAVPSIDLQNGEAPMPLRQLLGELRSREADRLARMISLQEELDWEMLAAYGLVSDDFPILREQAPPIQLGQRAFEIVLARQLASGETTTTWFDRHGAIPTTEVPADWPTEYRVLVERRIALIESDPDVRLVERPEHKRRWNRVAWGERQREALTTLVLDALEARQIWSDLRPFSTAELTDALRTKSVFIDALELLADMKDDDPASTVRRLVVEAAAPHLAAQRLTEKGLRKRQVWEQVWDLQRAEDRGEDVAPIPSPPKYAQADFRSATYWRHRGKLDVPKERFILIPNAERGADTSPVVGWAGWDERELARALAGRIMELREQHAADAERVTPLLAGVLELLPWIHQWHPDSDPLFGGPPGQYFESWLDGQLAELAITRDTLRSWRPPAPTRGRKAKAAST